MRSPAQAQSWWLSVASRARKSYSQDFTVDRAGKRLEFLNTYLL